MRLSRRTGRLFRTVRHLRASQVAWRVFLTGRRFLDRKLPSSALPEPRLSDQWSVSHTTRVPVWHGRLDHAQQVFSMARAGSLELLNTTMPFNGGSSWRLGSVTVGRLWVINLHYHAWIAELVVSGGDSDEDVRHEYAWRMLADWMQHCGCNADGAMSLAWNSFAIATRLRWWSRLLSSPAAAAMPAALRAAMAVSAAQQARVLATHLERDLCGNHLLRDAVGLAWAATLLDAPESSAWMQTASRITMREVGEQVLRDGGHCERSPMYHLHVLEDFAELALLLPVGSDAANAASGAVTKMAAVANWLCDADGNPASFNDGGPSGAPALEELEPLIELVVGAGSDRYGVTGGTNVLPDFGLAVHRGPVWGVRWDIGRVGPDWQPGHAHADTLTLDATVNGAPLLIDPGTYAYDADSRRAYDRSTRSHNTVRVNRLDSSECWDIFRVGRRAVPFDVDIGADAAGFVGVASHDGYRHLRGAPVHTRRVSVDGAHQRVLRVDDTLEGTSSAALDGGWLLHPSWTATALADGWVLAGQGRIMVSIVGPGGLRLSIERAMWHPDFGVEVPTSRLVWDLTEVVLPARIVTEFSLEFE